MRTQCMRGGSNALDWRDFDSELADEPDCAGATLGRTASAAVLLGKTAFAYRHNEGVSG